ncbi:MAG TPA: NAD(P)/FAD-dependent oxidoreductase [Cytophagaceae bacterium]|nr:NAD(P)/FAD-dependent oxidoreductase [Cytophagaceae bacterium]
MKPSILIVGAGAAGLMTAYELSRKGFPVTVVEASGRIGGRIHTIYNASFGQPVELGAEFVHGKLPLTLGLLKEASIDYKPVQGEFYRVKQGKWIEEEALEGWRVIEKKMNALEKDLPLEDFFSQYFNEPQYQSLRQFITGFAEGFELADTHRVSTKIVWEDWIKNEEEEYRIKGGYGKLIEYLEKICRENGVNFHNNFQVQKVTWKQNSVLLTAIDGRALQADKLVLAVPLSVLQSNDPKDAISFDPPLLQANKAFSWIGWGKVIKFIFKFRENLGGKRNTGFILSDEQIPTWWLQSPGDTTLLTGWFGGPKAETMLSVSEEELKEKALLSLANIFEKNIQTLKELLQAWEIVHWGKVENIEGGYSYDTTESAYAKKFLQTPVEETIYFAGEAIYTGPSGGTVEAALESGKKAADLLSEPGFTRLEDYQN